MPRASDVPAAISEAQALVAAIGAARATGTDGTFDDGMYMVSPTVTATHDGTAAAVTVEETEMARSGDFAG